MEPDETPPAVFDGISAESAAYQAAIDVLRTAGCRCMLRWDGTHAVPVTRTEGAACAAVDHYDDLINKET